MMQECRLNDLGQRRAVAVKSYVTIQKQETRFCGFLRLSPKTPGKEVN